MRELEKESSGRIIEGDALAFAAFTLDHAACGDGVLEVRIGERSLLEWCPSCAAMRVFVSPDGRGRPARA
jgi:hypothetical protein